jgi:transposase-like protein
MKTPQTLIEAVAFFSNTDNAHAYLVSKRWPNGVACPRCGCIEPSYISTRKIWKCKGCRKQFSVKVGTIFEDSKLGLDKWLTAVWIVVNAKNGVSSCEIARSLGVKQDTAWHMMHRIRTAMEVGTFERLEGEVECDETAIGGLEINKHKDKRLNVGGGSGGKEIVFGVRQRGGRVQTFHVPDSTKDTLQTLVRATAVKGSTVYTDTWKSYKGLGKDYDHKTVNHNFGQYKKGTACTNGMENYWTILKRAYKGTHVHYSPQHLFRYLAEEDFRFNSRAQNDGERFAAALKGIEGKRLTYKELTESHLETLEP